MPTTSSVASTKASVAIAGATVAAAGNGAVPTAAVAAAKGSQSPADFLAMLGQMLQGVPEEAAQAAVDAIACEPLETEPVDDGEEALDPATLADQVLAMASLGLPVSVPPPPATAAVTPRPVATAADDAPAEAVESLLAERSSANRTGGHELAAALDAFIEDARAPTQGADPALPGARADAAASQTAQSTTVQQTVSAAGQVTQLVSQTVANPFTTADAAPDPILQRVVHASVGTTAWANELGTRLTIMAGEGQHSASLRLSPEHLGPLEVRIDMNDDKASVFFGAQHADTRAALNEALPRLRELFAASGMTLADSGVSQQAPRQESRDTAARLAQALNGDSPSSAAIGGVTSVTSIANPGLLDLYA